MFGKALQFPANMQKSAVRLEENFDGQHIFLNQINNKSNLFYILNYII